LETAMSGKVLISPSELSDLMKAEPVVLIDTRDPAIYAEAHIPGAVDVREVFTYLANSTPEGMEALRDTFAASFGKAGLSGAETAVIYEQSMSAGFGQSCRGYVLLRYLGYPKIRVLHAVMRLGLPRAYRAQRRCRRRSRRRSPSIREWAFWSTWRQ